MSVSDAFKDLIYFHNKEGYLAEIDKDNKQPALASRSRTGRRLVAQ